MSDALDTLAGIAPGSFLDGLRRQKPITRDNAQASFDALFASDDLSQMSAEERAAVALFVAALHQHAPAIAFYRAKLDGLAETVLAVAADGAASGPYGHYPAGPLSAEDTTGKALTIAPAHRAALGDRLAAAFLHVHMLVFHLRDAAPADLRALETAGWSTTGIVTLSQLVAFLSFQIRAALGLRALAASRS